MLKEKDVVSHVIEKLNLRADLAELAVTETLACIRQEIARGGEVRFEGLMTISTKKRKGRKITDLKGVVHEAKDFFLPVCYFSKKLREEVKAFLK